MSDSWFVDPSSTVLQLPGGQWIEVKNRLSVGEERTAFQQVIGEVNDEGWRRPNVEMLGMAEVAQYLVGWSLTKDGKPVPIDTDGKKLDALKALNPDKYKLIEKAVQAHIEKMDAAEESRKNVQAGERGSATTSTSVT